MNEDEGDRHPRMCSKHRKHGRGLCRAWAVRGSDPPVCRFHGGATKRSRAKARRNVAMAEAERMVRRAGASAHPIEHLLDSLYRAAAQVEVYGQMIADLDNEGEVQAQSEPGRLRGWAERRQQLVATIRADGEQGVAMETVVDHDPLLVRVGDDRVALHPFVDEYNKALERRAKFAKLALDAGVAEREVQLMETQAAQLAEAIRSILTELGVPQDRRTVSVVQTHLRALSSPMPGEGDG